MLRIAQVADIHFGAEDTYALKAFDRELSPLKVDILAVCGDLTQHGSHPQFKAAEDWLDSIDLPKLVVAGNHDTPMWNMAKRLTNPFSTFDKLFADEKKPRSLGNHYICGLNTARGAQIRRNWAEGSVKLDRLQALIKPPAATPLSNGMLVVHHPFLPPSHSSMRTRTARGPLASHILANSEVDMLLCGHIHKPGVDLIQHGEGRYLSVTAGTLSTRLRQHPPSFNLIEIDKRAISITAFALDTAGTRQTFLGRWDAKTLSPLDRTETRTAENIS